MSSFIESAEYPEIALIQNLELKQGVRAVVLFPSVWSRAYSRFGTPYGRVHRDYHYQVMAIALATLAEAGCDRIQIDNPMPGYAWRRDAYVCLLEATRNIQACIRSLDTVGLERGAYEPKMVMAVEEGMKKFDLQAHRAIGICPHIFEGFNVRTVFVEKKSEMKSLGRWVN